MEVSAAKAEEYEANTNTQECVCKWGKKLNGKNIEHVATLCLLFS